MPDSSIALFAIQACASCVGLMAMNLHIGESWEVMVGIYNLSEGAPRILPSLSLALEWASSGFALPELCSYTVSSWAIARSELMRFAWKEPSFLSCCQQ